MGRITTENFGSALDDPIRSVLQRTYVEVHGSGSGFPAALEEFKSRLIHSDDADADPQNAPGSASEYCLADEFKAFMQACRLYNSALVHQTARNRRFNSAASISGSPDFTMTDTMRQTVPRTSVRYAIPPPPLTATPAPASVGAASQRFVAPIEDPLLSAHPQNFDPAQLHFHPVFEEQQFFKAFFKSVAAVKEAQTYIEQWSYFQRAMLQKTYELRLMFARPISDLSLGFDSIRTGIISLDALMRGTRAFHKDRSSPLFDSWAYNFVHLQLDYLSLYLSETGALAAKIERMQDGRLSQEDIAESVCCARNALDDLLNPFHMWLYIGERPHMLEHTQDELASGRKRIDLKGTMPRLRFASAAPQLEIEKQLTPEDNADIMRRNSLRLMRMGVLLNLVIYHAGVSSQKSGIQAALGISWDQSGRTMRITDDMPEAGSLSDFLDDGPQAALMRMVNGLGTETSLCLQEDSFEGGSRYLDSIEISLPNAAFVASTTIPV